MQNKYVLKIGQTGDLVRILQELLDLRPDGEFGNKTKAAVLAFQKQNKLTSDGIVGNMTWMALEYNPLELEADTDVTTSATWIEQYNLPDGEYVKQATYKEWIFLHHTAGRHNPKRVIDHWSKDQRGRVGTHYVIGGIPSGADSLNLKDNEGEWDGKIMQAIKDEYWGYHLGPVKSSKMHKGSISIEICSAGYLTQSDGKFLTWYGSEVHESQVCRLDVPYKEYRYYHKYSDEQIKSTKALILLLADKHGIDIKSGISALLKNNTKQGASQYYIISGNPDAFNYNESANLGKIKGVLTHGQVRQDKTDIFPQPEMITMLSSL
jgi:hypothetical protein|tara:strand:+ start:556 stop:1521 length:966 start_codon:yes stop_codon:yes gene_type:complete